jgi:hypothetical protein
LPKTEDDVTNLKRTALVAALVVCVGLSAALARAQSSTRPETAAQQAATDWLARVDAGKYAETWPTASKMFQAAITTEKWQSALHSVRDPLGQVLSRKLQGATLTHSLPGAPDGDYVVLKFDTSFEHKQSAVETITPMREADGQWRVSGYFIK